MGEGKNKNARHLFAPLGMGPRCFLICTVTTPLLASSGHGPRRKRRCSLGISRRGEEEKNRKKALRRERGRKFVRSLVAVFADRKLTGKKKV